tara:strand:- start:50 stop:298 length:249 start_codon:yes stop_codon:yes gene_type:complete
MRAYIGSFVKDGGESRRMYFARLEDMPQAFLEAKTTGTGTSPTQTEGKELVWDLQANGFRVFNYNTQQGDLSVFEYDENKLV